MKLVVKIKVNWIKKKQTEFNQLAKLEEKKSDDEN